MDKCHFIGIGGIGMSGLAHIMLSKNAQVSGSDLSQNYQTEELTHRGAKVYSNHSAKYISPEMTVIYSTDIKAENPEFQAALDLKCKLMHRSELLQILLKQHRYSLAITGTHGKTTTSALLAWVLKHAELQPSFAIGGFVPQLKGNAGQGTGDYFVAEACESDGSFLNYTAAGAIVTNIDLDHMDYYQNEDALINAFQTFMNKVTNQELLFWCSDDRRLSIMDHQTGISYGFGKNCSLKINQFQQTEWQIFLDIEFKGNKYHQIDIPLVGKHNALNALAVFGMAISLGISEEMIRKAFKSFSGVNRRCEKKGEKHGILFLDDYGHHPTEIASTLQAIRQSIRERRLVVVYQPHRYSRTKACKGMYSHVFNHADHLFVTEIYSAGEVPIPGVSHEHLIQEVQENKVSCQFVPRNHIAEQLFNFLRPHDVLVTFGAGDVTKVCFEVISLLNLKALPKLKVGVIYGGMSVEHEVSLTSSEHICHSLNPTFYEVEHFGITKKGQWISGNETRKNLRDNPPNGKGISHEILLKLEECDILFPVLHGPYGEDGMMQGFFEILGKAYVGCDHRSSAICMDKVITKRLMFLGGIRTLPFVSFSRFQWQTSPEIFLKEIQRELEYPLFVKPTHLGSSIGVQKVDRFDNLVEAIEQAFRFDTDVLVENGLTARELEFSVLGNDQVTVFPPGEILTEGTIYTYEGKYSKKNSTPTNAKAELPIEIVEKGKVFAKRAYIAAGCKGMARVDTFLDKENRFWLNEINPIPGFTHLSLFPQMCAVNGLGSHELIDKLIILGLQRKREIDKLENNIK